MKIDKKKLTAALVIIVLGALAIAGFFWYQAENYVTTVDARIDADMVNITSIQAGRLISWNGFEGQAVGLNEKLGTVDAGAAVSSINAPAKGRIIRVNVHEGQAVSIGQAVGVIADVGKIFISANIEETKVNKVEEGQLVEIKIDAYPKKVFFGRVAHIGEAVNSVFSAVSSSSSNGNYTKITQLIPIKITFEENYKENFKLGMNAEIKIDIKSDEKDLSSDNSNQPIKTDGNQNTLVGVLSPIYSYDVSAKVSGQVISIEVAKGDVVISGEVLAKQDAGDIQLTAGQGSTTAELLQRLKVTYDSAENSYQRNRELYETGAIPEKTLNEIKTQRDNAKLQYEGTANAIAEQTAKATIQSPGKGIVTSLNIQKGDYLNAGAKIATVADISQMVLKVNILESDLVDISKGKKVDVRVDSLDKTFEGIITFISPVSVVSGQMFPIEITINNQNEEIKAGMTASAKL